MAKKRWRALLILHYLVVKDSELELFQNPIRTILKSCVGNNVSSTIIDGKWLMKNKKLINIDEKLLLNEMQKQ